MGNNDYIEIQCQGVTHAMKKSKTGIEPKESRDGHHFRS